MSRIATWTSVLLLLAIILPACATDPVAPVAPPPLQQETLGAAPSVVHVWVPGHWEWHGHWVWKPGYWRKPPYEHATWVPGHWTERRSGWVWVEGHWRAW